MVIARNNEATRVFQAQPEAVFHLFDQALLSLTQTGNDAAAWKTLLDPDKDRIGIKVLSVAGSQSGTRPAVAEAVVRSLLKAGVPSNHVIIWDKHLADLERAGFGTIAARWGIGLAGSAERGYDEKVFYENSLIGNLLWSDLEFGKKGEGVGRKSFVSRLLTEDITRIIQVTPLLNHNLAGVSGHLWSLAGGSVDNFQRFENDGRSLAIALPEIYALPALGDRVVLNLTDALICQYEGEQKTLLHYSIPLNQLWLSKDPVALDVLAINELDRQRSGARIPTRTASLEIYQNASLLDLGVSNPKQVEFIRRGSPPSE